MLATLRYVFEKLFIFSKSESLLYLKHIKCLFLSIQLPNGILIFRSLCTWCFHRKNLLPSEVKESHFFLLCLVWLYSFLAKTPPFFSSFKATEAKLSLDLPAMLVEQFFPTKVSPLFIFKPWAEQKNSHS